MRCLLTIVSLLMLAGCVQDNRLCATAFTPISQIQGSGDQSPLLNQQVTTQGVVTGIVYPETPAAGLMLQSLVPDNDNQTSEGIYVRLTENLQRYQPGQLLQLQAVVAELNQQTTLIDSSAITVCSSGHPVKPVTISLPLADDLSWESLEGMWLSFSQTLVVNDTYPLGRYGEILLADERLWQATEVVAPGDPARAYMAQQQQRQIWLDDGLWQQNPDPIRYPEGGLSASNTLRIGDQVQQVEGFLWQDERGYRLVPTRKPEFIQANPRPEAPVAKLDNSLRVASFNVLNFFNGSTQQQPFPTRRGATNAQEFERQQAKLVSALAAMDADVIGLLEVENNGYGPQSALAALVDALNKQSKQPYAFISTEQTPGTDVIKVALIYRPSQVSPLGQAALNTEAPFRHGSRVPLAQSFLHQSSQQLVTISVNHFKSKGSCPKEASANADQQDGQACWNAARVEAAATLADWLQSQPTGVKTDKQLILGDLNAYRQEDPISRLQQAGWQYLSSEHSHYSYVFRGRTGSLDHMLATPALADTLQQLQHWAINADEPAILDYNLEYKSASQQKNLYAPTPYRSSDHDPLIATFIF